MSKKLRFGVLSTANIGLKKVIPAMQQGELTTVAAIASRDLAKAREAADALGIPKAYGSYEELLADPNIDAIYNPLPNQLHVPLTVKAAEAGKHVLCEKPLSMTVAEAKTLLGVRERTGVKICEAFMIRSAQQWLRVRQLLDEGRIGELRAVNAHFSYHNVNPANIRNQVETGGGGVYDIGCYCIQASRFAFKQEPRRVVALVDRDPQLGTDRLASAILDFPSGQAIFTCSTQLIPYPEGAFSGHARAASNWKFPSTRPTTGPRASSSTRPATSASTASPRRLSPRRISTRCKATHSRARFSKTPRFRFRLKIPSPTWPSLKPSSAPGIRASGKLVRAIKSHRAILPAFFAGRAGSHLTPAWPPWRTRTDRGSALPCAGDRCPTRT